MWTAASWCYPWLSARSEQEPSGTVRDRARDRYSLERRWPGEQGLSTLVWERWHFPKPTRPNSLRVQGATSDAGATRRQGSRGGHHEHPETQEPAVVKSTRRQARTRSTSSRRNQSQEIPKQTQPLTRCTNNTRINPTVTIRTLCFLTDLRSSHVI